MTIACPCIAAEYKAEVVCERTLRGIGYEPSVWSRYPITYGEDVTGQYGLREPNLSVTLIQADNATILKMKDDGIVVLWMAPKADTKPLPKATKVQLDTLKADLSAKGIIPADIAKTALSDTSKADVTAVDIATQLKAVMKEFPAAKVVEEVKK
jgi:hypothetical protein